MLLSWTEKTCGDEEHPCFSCPTHFRTGICRSAPLRNGALGRAQARPRPRLAVLLCFRSPLPLAFATPDARRNYAKQNRKGPVTPFRATVAPSRAWRDSRFRVDRAIRRSLSPGLAGLRRRHRGCGRDIGRCRQRVESFLRARFRCFRRAPSGFGCVRDRGKTLLYCAGLRAHPGRDAALHMDSPRSETRTPPSPHRARPDRARRKREAVRAARPRQATTADSIYLQIASTGDDGRDLARGGGFASEAPPF